MEEGKNYGTLMLVEFLGDPYHPLEALAWIFGWKVAALRPGCDIPTFVILCISLITLIQISFRKHCCVDDVYIFLP